MNKITIRGARTHNLKNIDLDLPRDQLIVITGLSGSGKSSLAFDTLYAEGQRRYVESLSAYARQFLSMMEKPDVDLIEGLSPAISIEQKSTSHNPRSTVGTITEIYDYLRLLFARVGEPRCPEHHILLACTNRESNGGSSFSFAGRYENHVIGTGGARSQRRTCAIIAEHYAAKVLCVRALMVNYMNWINAPKLDLRKKHTIEVVVDRIKVKPDMRQRLAESFETALQLADGLVNMAFMDDKCIEEMIFSCKFACPDLWL